MAINCILFLIVILASSDYEIIQLKQFLCCVSFCKDILIYISNPVQLFTLLQCAFATC